LNTFYLSFEIRLFAALTSFELFFSFASTGFVSFTAKGFTSFSPLTKARQGAYPFTHQPINPFA